MGGGLVAWSYVADIPTYAESRLPGGPYFFCIQPNITMRRQTVFYNQCQHSNYADLEYAYLDKTNLLC